MLPAVCASLRAAFVGARLFHASASCSKVVQFNLSDIGEGIREVTVKGWFVGENDVVAQFDDVCEVESDKATVTITSRFDGRVTRLYHGVGDKALVGRPLLDIDVADEEAVGGNGDVEVTTGGSGETPKTVSPTEQPPELSSSKSSETLTADSPSHQPLEEAWNKSLATPAVRRIAMENKIKLHDVKGSGKNGRVMKEDILAYVETIKSSKPTETKVVQNQSVVPLSQVQRIMARNLTQSVKIPHFVFNDEIDVTELVKLMSDAKKAAEKKDVKLSYVPMFLKAISKGLLEYPILNSSYDEEGYIIYKHCHNIGVAFDSPNGLVVPNIKNVQDLTVLQITKELNRLKALASQLKLAPSDFTGGTFSVSNIGSVAGISGIPTILPPEVCIVAIGRIQKLPRFDSTGNVVAVNVMTISWTADHRLLDGATVARCSQVFKYYVENPTALMLDL